MGPPDLPCTTPALLFAKTALQPREPRDFLSKSLTLVPYLLPSPFPSECLKSPSPDFSFPICQQSYIESLLVWWDPILRLGGPLSPPDLRLHPPPPPTHTLVLTLVPVTVPSIPPSLPPAPGNWSHKCLSDSSASVGSRLKSLSPPPLFSTPPTPPQLWRAAGRHHELFPCYFPAPELLAPEQLVSSRSLGGALWSRQGATEAGISQQGQGLPGWGRSASRARWRV